MRASSPRCAGLAHACPTASAASSTICVRHHDPSPSRSGSCTTRPAACRSSSQRCTLRRCARTNRARSAAIARDRTPADHRRQPHDQLRDRRRVARRPRRVPEPEQVALDRVRARLQPIVARRRAPARSPRPGQQTRRPPAARARPAAARSPADTNDATSPEHEAADARSSGTANARRRHGSTKHCARERTLAAQLDRRRAGRCEDASARRPDPSKGVGDPSGSAATVRATFICGRSPRGGAEWPEGRRRRPGGYPVFVVLRPPSPAGRGMRTRRTSAAPLRRAREPSAVRAVESGGAR